MTTYKIRTSGNHIEMEEMTKKKINSATRQTQDVSVKLSKNVLKQMKKVAGIKNETSNNAILYAYITKTLQDA